MLSSTSHCQFWLPQQYGGSVSWAYNLIHVHQRYGTATASDRTNASMHTRYHTIRHFSFLWSSAKLYEETCCGTGTMGMHIGTMGDCIDCMGCMGCIVCMGCIGCMFGIMQFMLPAACKGTFGKVLE